LRDVFARMMWRRLRDGIGFMNLPTVFDCSARELGAYQVANTPVVGLHLLKLKRSYAVPTPGLSFRLLVPRIPVLRSFRQLRGSRSCLRTLQNYV
jgi:hypothetical protein